MAKTVKRRYRSARRREQAEETRSRIIDAAHHLFVTQGYGRSTIAEVARAAGVAVETIYAVYRNKATLLRHVWYSAMRGDDEDVRLLDRPEIRTVLAEPDLAKRLRAHAVVMTSVFRRFTPLFRALQGAASTEPVAATILAEFDERRLDAAAHYASAAAITGKLAISEEECRDVFAATLDGALWHRLVEERGWTDDRFAEFLGSMWIAAFVQLTG
jgi:AcrR family transcriptional regulator